MIALALATLLAAQPAEVEGQVHEVVLANGMRWLIVERHDAPVFTGMIRLRVGGADEQPGATGLAHLFEHMAFKGTPRLGAKDWAKEQPLLRQIFTTGDALAWLERTGQGQTAEAAALRERLKSLSAQHDAITDENALATLYQLNGAVGLNATTDKDLTSYFVSLPKNRLELYLTVEAQRLAAPVLRDFFTERDVVLEERRMRIDSDPGGALYEELSQLAFVQSPYRWPTVGYREDLQAMTAASAQAFFDKFYAPANAVGCLVGDVSADQVKPLLEKTFGQIASRPAPPAPVFAEAPARAQRRSKVLFDAAPRLYLGFHKPPPPHRDDFAFDLFQVLLGSGRTGRLHQRLVLKDRLAQSVGVFTGPGARLPALFVVAITPMEGASLEAIEKAVWDELGRLEREPIPAAELEKVRNRVSADLARALDTHSGLASSLTHAQAIVGDWRYAFRQPGEVASFGAEELQAVARRSFRPERSVAVELSRPPKPADTATTKPQEKTR